jgi:methionyl-tRNA formyltransferase
MRIGILANSFSAAWRIYSGFAGVQDVEVFMLLAPRPGRAKLVSWLANFVQLVFTNLSPRPLFHWRRVVMLPGGFNDPESVAAVKRLNLDVGLHKSGIIYRDEIINAFRLGILNPHIGLLPKYRGRSVMEWSLLNGDPTGITVFFIDAGIDTGSRIVISEEVDVSHCKSVREAKQFLFDLDADFFRRAVALLRDSNVTFAVNDGSGRRHYVMSKLFLGVVEDLIREPVTN